MLDARDSRAIVRIGGACALLGVLAGMAGSIVSTVSGLAGQAIPVATQDDLLTLAQKQPYYVAREWLFLIYAIFVVGEGAGLYALASRARTLAVWAAIAWGAGIIVGIIQDAAAVAFVQQFPTAFLAADPPTRSALAALAGSTLATIAVQQSIANVLLSVGVALFSIALFKTRAVSVLFLLLGIASASAGIFYAAVTTMPGLSGWATVAEYAFGVVVIWDVAAAMTMLSYVPVEGGPSAFAEATADEKGPPLRTT